MTSTQPRSAVTRQKIVDAAATMFMVNGYLETDVKSITRAADLTPGAFYYHFESKEALVVEIVNEGWSRIWKLVSELLSVGEPSLERVITTTVAQTDLFSRDKLVWVAVQLNAAFGHLSEQGRRELQAQFDQFVEMISANIRPQELRDDVSPQDVAELVWMMLQGSSHFPDVTDPLAVPALRAIKNWGFIVRVIVPDDALPHYRQLLADMAAQRLM